MKKDLIKANKTINLIIYLAVAITLIGCTTQAKQDARRSCDAASLVKFPHNYQEYTYTVSELIAVPSGITICDTQYIMNTAQTVCKQQTKLVPQDKRVTSVMDVNEKNRSEEKEKCAIEICMQSHGNSKCKSD